MVVLLSTTSLNQLAQWNSKHGSTLVSHECNFEAPARHMCCRLVLQRDPEPWYVLGTSWDVDCPPHIEVAEEKTRPRNWSGRNAILSLVLKLTIGVVRKLLMMDLVHLYAAGCCLDTAEG
jgi:hypothetical protein